MVWEDQRESHSMGKATVQVLNVCLKKKIQDFGVGMKHGNWINQVTLKSYQGT